MIFSISLSLFGVNFFFECTECETTHVVWGNKCPSAEQICLTSDFQKEMDEIEQKSIMSTQFSSGNSINQTVEREICLNTALCT
jgi:hypothetical protein